MTIRLRQARARGSGSLPPVGVAMTWGKLWIGLAVAALVVFGIPAAVMAATFLGNAPLVDGRALPGGAVTIVDGYVSMYLIPTGDGRYLLIDAGNDPEAAAIDRALASRSATRADVAAIALTHGHGDHTAACAAFPSATVYALDKEGPVLRGEAGTRGPLPRLFGAQAAPCAAAITYVADGAAVPVGPLVARVFATPGHTVGSATWLVNGVLFFGDEASATSDGAVTPAPWVFSDDQGQATDALVGLVDRLDAEHLTVEALAFAHTGPLTSMAPLATFAQHHR
ncbi:MAG: MBL fold metallo-hydrolase [Myxococcota bacterium]